VTKRPWLVIVLLIAAGGGMAWWWIGRTAPGTVWQGYADADFVKVGPTQAGKLIAVFVQRGDAVAAGAKLFDQDDISETAARDQAVQLVAQAERQLGNLQAGGKTTAIAQAEANLADANATMARTAADLQRGEALLPRGAMAKQDVDALRASYKSAQAHVDALQAALAQQRAPMGRTREIEGQTAAMAASRAAMAMAEWRLGERHVTAPVAARVADVLARPGETMAAGAPVVSLLPPGNIFVRFFVPEDVVSGLHRGDRVALACDGCAADMSATISYIAPQAEYTPPVIYSEESREKLVFLVEAKPPADRAALLNPGQPVEVRPVVTRQTGARAP
jgi:HlyD family secretion protein